MKVIELAKQKTVERLKTPWRSNVDSLSRLLVVGTYAYSVYWLWNLSLQITGIALVFMVLFIISSAIRLSERLEYNSDLTFYGHLFLDICLIVILNCLLKTYTFVPILFALTALGCSGQQSRYVVLTAGLSVSGILITEMWNSNLSSVILAFNESISVLFNLLIIIGYARIINELFIQRTQLQKQKNQLSEKHEELEQAYDALYLGMQEREALAIQQERNRMSGELHDHMGHAMATSLIQLQYVQKVMSKSPEKALETLAQVYGHLNQSYEEIRRFVRESQVTYSPQHTLAQLTKKIEALQVFSQLELTVSTTAADANTPLSAEQETHLLRIIQETMTNSLKHGQAEHLQIHIETKGTQEKELLTLTLADDGVGCIGLVQGFGLGSLRNRVNQLGGQIYFESMPNKGFVTTIQLPLRNREQELAV